MFVVYVTKNYDKIKMKTINWTEKMDVYRMIPSIDNGELKIFDSVTIKEQEIPSFIEYMRRNKLMIFHHIFIGGYGKLDCYEISSLKIRLITLGFVCIGIALQFDIPYNVFS